MCKFNPKNDSRKLDPCMKLLIRFLKRDRYDTKASCCGHGKYPMTIVVKMWTIQGTEYVEILSGKTIPRETKFYKKDKEGFYYIPETIQSNQRICECGHDQWDDHKSSFYNYKGLKMVAQECSVKGCKCKKFVKGRKGVK